MQIDSRSFNCHKQWTYKIQYRYDIVQEKRVQNTKQTFLKCHLEVKFMVLCYTVIQQVEHPE